MKKPVTTLVIDDNPSVLQLVGAILNAEGARVLLASNAEEGLECMRSQAIDVLFTDLRLPGEDGISVIRKSLQLRPQIASVVFTGEGTLETAVEALRLGACDYVTKPIDRQKIVAALHRALSLTDIAKATEQQTAVSRTNGKSPQMNLVAVSARMREVVSLAAKLASLDVPVLIQGETGVGKKLLARSIHCQSSRADSPFSHIVCSVLRDDQPESGLFIRQYVGIQEDHPWNGLAGRSGGGTIFLEDIDHLPLWVQVQLLDVVEGSWLPTPWTSSPSIGAVRVIASTTTDLEAAVSAGRFHRGLYDHLNLMPIKVPPLRERREDIKPLATHFLEQFSRSQNRNSAQFQLQVTEEVWEMLHHYDWPGNVRELASVLGRVVLLGDGAVNDRTLREQLQTSQQLDSGEMIIVPLTGDIKSMERHMIREVVKRHGGNKAAAARALGMHRRTLYRVLENGKPNRSGGTVVHQSVGSQD